MTTSSQGTQPAEPDPYSPLAQQEFAEEWNSGHFTDLPLDEQVAVLTYWSALASNDQIGNLRNRMIYITSVYTGDKAALMAALPLAAQEDIANQWASEWKQEHAFTLAGLPDDMPCFPIVFVPDPRLDPASKSQRRRANIGTRGIVEISQRAVEYPGGHSFLLGGPHER
jgi:hypothetical protein